jgi:hypothetical protein
VTRRTSANLCLEVDLVEIKRTDGSIVPIYPVWRPLPRAGRSLLLRCWFCGQACRALYDWRVGDNGRFYSVQHWDWQCCRTCAKLRYSSEGGHLRPGAMFRALGNFPRPDSWFPYVFTSIDAASDFIAAE